MIPAHEHERNLLVPVNVEALVVGSSPPPHWITGRPAFERLGAALGHLGTSLQREECILTDPPLEPGVHLHWALPDGLTHGVVRRAGGPPEFPRIPNRWLVVRLWRAPGDEHGPLRRRAWIVESDAIASGREGAPWPNPWGPGQGRGPIVRVGRRHELEKWPGKPHPPHVKLSALGYGDPAFAAFYPLCREILGLHDDLADVGGLAAGTSLTYAVAGWYAQPSQDPLHLAVDDAAVHDTSVPLQGVDALLAAVRRLARLSRFLEETRWSLPGAEVAARLLERARAARARRARARRLRVRLGAARPGTAIPPHLEERLQQGASACRERCRALTAEFHARCDELPRRTMCHGVVAGVGWEHDGPHRDGIPDRERDLKVAIGNNLVEAVSALLRPELGDAPDGLADLLEAFQLDLLPQLERPMGEVALAQGLHERTFRPRSRGKRWEVRGPSVPTGGEAEDTSPTAVPGEIRVLLQQVNAAQRTIDETRRTLEARQSELYAAWYRTQLDPGDGAPRERQATLQGEVEDLALRLRGLCRPEGSDVRPAVPAWDELKARMAQLLPGSTLEHADDERFWRPNDPVMVLAGAAARRAQRHGEDGRLRRDGRLLCRSSGAELAGVEIAWRGIPDFLFGPRAPAGGAGTSDLDDLCPPVPAAGDVRFPSVCETLRALFREALLLSLDGASAVRIARAAFVAGRTGLPADRQEERIRALSSALLEEMSDRLLRAASPEGSGPAGPPETDASSRAAPFQLCAADRAAGGAHGPIFPSAIAVRRWTENPWLPLLAQWQVTWTASAQGASQALDGWTLDEATGTRFALPGPAHGRTHRFSGSALLTPDATIPLSDRLPTLALSGPLEPLARDLRSMNVLGQSLGGFHDELLLRRARLELRPLELDPSGRLRRSEVGAAVEGIEWLSPITASGAEGAADHQASPFPVRAGDLQLDQLWIVDAFGQLLRLNRSSEALRRPRVHPRVAAPDPGRIRLEPRLAQPARLTVEWLGKGWKPTAGTKVPDEDASPVCGWILPNHLDCGLAIYDAAGRALGHLQAVQGRPGQGADETGGGETYHWVDAPWSKESFLGRPPGEGPGPLEDEDPDLRDFVRALLHLTGQPGAAFAHLLEVHDDALSAGRAAGTSRDRARALLYGTPLALVRAAFRLELDGEGDGLAGVQVPLRLGDRRPWRGLWLGDDGLVGFFRRGDPGTFHAAYGIAGAGAAPPDELRVSTTPIEVALLMDPSRGACATTGILPRVVCRPPFDDLAEILDNKQVTFFTGPIVGTAEGVRMPRPADLYGQWSWIHHPAVEVWRPEAIARSEHEDGWVLRDRARVSEGWLRLVPEEVEIRAFGVRGARPVQSPAATAGAEPETARFEVPTTSPVILHWDVRGADELELEVVPGERWGEPHAAHLRWTRHPLPAQLRVPISGAHTLTLVATGRQERGAGAATKVRRVIEVVVS